VFMVWGELGTGEVITSPEKSEKKAAQQR